MASGQCFTLIVYDPEGSLIFIKGTDTGPFEKKKKIIKEKKKFQIYKCIKFKNASGVLPMSLKQLGNLEISSELKKKKKKKSSLGFYDRILPNLIQKTSRKRNIYCSFYLYYI